MDTSEVLLELSDAEVVSGEEIAEDHGVSRNAVWKHIQRLRDSGFEIESTAKGYRLTEAPEYGGFGVEYHLQKKQENEISRSNIGHKVEYHEEVGSTNEVCEELARGGEEEGVVVLSNVQKKGKGRRGREWVSSEGGVWMSLLLRPSIPLRDASVITLTASVAVSKAIEDLGLKPNIKWPNDVLIDGKKVCGILVEMQGDAESVEYAVVGIGINANNKVDVEKWDATSLKDELGYEVNRAELGASVLSKFDELYQGERQKVFDEWRERTSTIGRKVKVETVNREIEGEAVDIDSTGALRIETDGGEQIVTAGDCKHLR